MKIFDSVKKWGTRVFFTLAIPYVIHGGYQVSIGDTKLREVKGIYNLLEEEKENYDKRVQEFEDLTQYLELIDVSDAEAVNLLEPKRQELSELTNTYHGTLKENLSLVKKLHQEIDTATKRFWNPFYGRI